MMRSTTVFPPLGSFVLIFIKIRHLTPKCPHAPWTLTFIRVVTYLVSYSYVYVFAYIIFFLFLMGRLACTVW